MEFSLQPNITSRGCRHFLRPTLPPLPPPPPIHSFSASPYPSTHFPDGPPISLPPNHYPPPHPGDQPYPDQPLVRWFSAPVTPAPYPSVRSPTEKVPPKNTYPPPPLLLPRQVSKISYRPCPHPVFDQPPPTLPFPTYVSPSQNAIEKPYIRWFESQPPYLAFCPP